MTILYLTDNSLDERLALKVREILVKEAQGTPIVAVSQKPIELIKNVCVGKIGRSWYSLYKQLLAGLEAVETEYVAIAEHDCLYTNEHFSWTPPTKDTFYYNRNQWLVQWGGNHPELNGMYSYWPKRVALSQLVCSKDLLISSTKEILNLIDMGLKVRRGVGWCGEPGIQKLAKASEIAVSGTSHQLQDYLNQYISHYKSDFFETEKPNLDIRHSTNFTGAKRGKKRTYELPYWGEFKNIIT